MAPKIGENGSSESQFGSLQHIRLLFLQIALQGKLGRAVRVGQRKIKLFIRKFVDQHAYGW